MGHVMDPVAVALWCAIPLGVALLLDGAELVTARAQLREGGLYGYRVLATGNPILLSGPVARPLGALFRYPMVLALPVTQLMAGAVLVAAGIAGTPVAAGAAGIVGIPVLAGAAGVAALIALASRMLLYLRNQLGLDGSDQMMLVAATGVAVALLVPDEMAKTVVLVYVALQLLLSYAVAGLAKATSTTWRSGRAVPAILNTIGYGFPAVGAYLAARPKLGGLLSWATILFECSAPLLILFGTSGAIVIIVAGLMFHISIAVMMGLNIFPWSFGATYPALLLLASFIDRLWV
ncbi:MAG: hypothetical protein ACOH1Y_04125 [Propionicimonas sp.]